MAKSKKAKSKKARNATKVDLPSMGFASPGTAPSFEIGPNGVIADGDAPGIFGAAKGAVVAWDIKNSGQPVTVALMSFLRKKTFLNRRGERTDPIDDYFYWLTGNSINLGGTNRDGTVNPNEGFLYARVTKKPKFLLGDFLSYTIRVTADDGSFDIYYDPDGEIKP